MRTIILIPLFVLLFNVKNITAQTLQQVTDNGATTSSGISVAAVTANSSSLPGSNVPTNISMLNGYRINGSVPDVSHNGITYQSGGGGGAAITFFRGGNYDTGMDFYTNGALDYGSGNLQHRMRIGSNGNVGVGSLFPDNKLTIRDDNPFVDIQSAEDGQKTGIWMRYRNSSYAGAKFYYSTIDAVTYIDNLYPNHVGSSYDSLNIRSNNGQGELVSRLFVHGTSGDLGIGTTDPKGYKLAVNGNIRAKEIKVEISNWPDYVFAKDYTLPSLAETEKHIKEKGHLTGMPSAKEAETNGIDLGEMNAKLLKKIEELTLHLIYKEKEIDKINSKVEQLVIQLEKISQKVK